MSDILIRNMEMPKKCLTCPCLEYNMFDDDIDGYCKMLKTKITNSDKHHPNYPLIELPPHGRLGDLDALYAEISNGNKAYNGIDGYDGEYLSIANVDDCLDAIKYADTVIEAEGREE